MTVQRVFHWKHGWIPLDHYAALEKANGRESRQVGGFRLTTVNGYPDVYFKEVLELDKRPPEQYREVAKVASDVLRHYPRAASNPIELGFSNELMPSVMADTNNAKPHRIRLNTSMWDDPTDISYKMADMRANHFGLTAEAASVEQFRANVLTHEIGHVLHMRDLDELSTVPMSEVGNPEWGAIEAFITEEVTPRQMGYHATAAAGGLDGPLTRWQLDSLNGRSAYATSNPYEFFAEAFLDGTVNGDQASESGKRAVQIAGKVFGPGSPSVRDRLYGKGAS
jgi:hypothetical protein